MDIYAKEGHRVIFLNCNGYEGQPERAREAGLIPGDVYIVSSTTVHDWDSTVTLKDFPGHKFNTVMFADDGETLEGFQEVKP